LDQLRAVPGSGRLISPPPFRRFLRLRAPGESAVGTKSEEFYSSHTLLGPGKRFAGTVIEYQVLGIEPDRYDDMTAKRGRP